MPASICTASRKARRMPRCCVSCATPSARDARLVLVITGKGRGGEPGVLRRQVPQWLGLPEFRTLVIGFEDAHVAHGGEGALYVRLRAWAAATAANGPLAGNSS